jgi:hypothetical protein
MTNAQIENQIKKTRKQVNTLSKMSLEGDVTITININEKDYNSFESIQNKIINEIIIAKTNLKIRLFFIWNRTNI